MIGHSLFCPNIWSVGIHAEFYYSWALVRSITMRQCSVQNNVIISCLTAKHDILTYLLWCGRWSPTAPTYLIRLTWETEASHGHKRIYCANVCLNRQSEQWDNGLKGCHDRLGMSYGKWLCRCPHSLWSQHLEPACLRASQLCTPQDWMQGSHWGLGQGIVGLWGAVGCPPKSEVQMEIRQR